ncbi:t-SNARE [Aspergillus venezuelensis]
MSSYNNAYPAYGEPQQNPYGGNQGYGQNPYDHDVEMNPVQPRAADANALFNEIQKMKDGIASIRDLRENRLAVALNAQLEANSQREDQTASAAVNEIQSEIMTIYRKLLDDVKRVKQTPGSANVQTQLEVQGRNAKKEFDEYQNNMLTHRRRLQEQAVRRWMTAKGCSQEEAQEAVASQVDSNVQAFQVTGNRSRLANDALDANAARHKDIASIVQGITELAELVNQLAEAVQQQDESVRQIDQGAENVAQDLGNANVQLGQAVESARKARRWKWYALIIVIIIIAIIVAVAVGVTQSK